MDKKIWPIETAPTCKAKWNWSTIYLANGASASCHRTTQYKFNLDSFDDFHNLPEKLRDRQMMLDGEWPGNGCEYCKKIEDVGGVSDRIFQNTTEDTLTPNELFDNPTATNVVPKIVEVYFDNTCDLKCVYCGPWYSSAWQAENKKFGRFITGKYWLKDDYQISNNRRAYVEKFWAWWDRHYDQIEVFQFLGGEPFVQPEFDEFLDFLEQHENPKLRIVISSNLNCSNDRLVRMIERFKKLTLDKKIQTLQIVGSIDCWGPEQEHIRFPLDLKNFEKNFEHLVSQDWLTLNINSAVNSLSIKAMPELLRKLNHWRKTREVYQMFMTVQDPHPLNPDYLGGEIFKEDFKIILDLMNESKHLNHWYEKVIPYMEGISKQMAASQPNLQKIQELHDYLDELDRRRGTNWPTIYPWLVEEFNKYDLK